MNATCPSCKSSVTIREDDAYISFMGIRGYAMQCTACTNRWVEPVPQIGCEAVPPERDTDPITQPSAPTVTECWRCNRTGAESRYSERLWCTVCGTWLDEFVPQIAKGVA